MKKAIRSVVCVLLVLVLMATLTTTSFAQLVAFSEAQAFYHYGIMGSSYFVGIPEGQTKLTLVDSVLAASSSNTITVKTSANGNVANSEIMKTGMRITINGSLKYAVIFGDVSGDGVIDVVDITTMRAHSVGNTTLTGSKLKAGDVNEDGSVDVADIALVNHYIVNNKLGDVTITDVSGETYNLNGFYDWTESCFDSLNYNNIIHSTSPTKNQAINNLHSSSVFIYNGNGNSTSLLKNSASFLSISDINALDNNYFSNCRLVVLCSSNSGYGGDSGNNLVNAIYNKGAKTVIGFNGFLSVGARTDWCCALSNGLANGETIAQAVFEANHHTMANFPDEYLALCANVIKGDVNQRIANFQTAKYTDLDGSLSNYHIDNSYISTINPNENVNAISATARKVIAKSKIDEYFDSDYYNFYGEAFSSSLGIYTLYYTRTYNNLPVIDYCVVMMNKGGDIKAFTSIADGEYTGLENVNLQEEDVISQVNEKIAQYNRSLETRSYVDNIGADGFEIIIRHMVDDYNDNHDIKIVDYDVRALSHFVQRKLEAEQAAQAGYKYTLLQIDELSNKVYANALMYITYDNGFQSAENWKINVADYITDSELLNYHFYKDDNGEIKLKATVLVDYEGNYQNIVYYELDY